MINLRKLIIKITAIVVVIFALTSCDNELNSVGTNIVGELGFNNDKYESKILGTNNKINRVQTSSLSNNLLGVYDDPIYGESKYSILSQVELNAQAPTFGDNAILDSVVLNLPYFSTVERNAQTGEVVNTYTLDSVYGGFPMELSIYESNYFLRDFDIDSNLEDRQLYYSNDIASFGTSIEGTLLYESPYTPLSNEIVLLAPDGNDDDTNPEITRETPRLRLKLPIDFFTTKILDKEGQPELSNPNNFRNHFRGIYFKTESVGGRGSLVYFDMSQANILLYYSFDKIDTLDEDNDGDVTDLVRDEANTTISFTNNIINLIENDFPTAITNEIENPTADQMGQNLFLKGGEGVVGEIELFKDLVEDQDTGEMITELEFLKKQNWLINEANIDFFVNENLALNETNDPGGNTEPLRIYLYNTETGLPLFDFNVDATRNDNNPLISRIDHLGPLENNESQGKHYSIRITDHVNRVINEDQENVKLGIAVSQNVNLTNAFDFFSTSNDTEANKIPLGAIISHEGTVLYGPNAADESKRLKLNIFYTESN